MTVGANNTCVVSRTLSQGLFIDHMWVSSAGLLILLMQAGFTMLEAGSIRQRTWEIHRSQFDVVQNARGVNELQPRLGQSTFHILLKNIIDMATCAICWSAIGCAVFSAGPDFWRYWFFQDIESLPIHAAEYQVCSVCPQLFALN